MNDYIRQVIDFLFYFVFGLIIAFPLVASLRRFFDPDNLKLRPSRPMNLLTLGGILVSSWAAINLMFILTGSPSVQGSMVNQDNQFASSMVLYPMEDSNAFTTAHLNGPMQIIPQ